MKTTLFLGAGFSAHFGHPVMDRFFEFADACPRLTKEDRALLDELALEARRANSFLESSPTNLEDILSFAVMGERTEVAATEGSRLERLKRVIQKVYTRLSTADKYWGMHEKDSIADLFGSDLNSLAGDLRVITTNYDLNIECSCFIRGQQLDPGFEIKRLPLPPEIPVVSRYYRTHAIPLFKLHGSVNWFPSGSDNVPLVDDSQVAIHSFGRVGHGESQLPYPCVGNYQAPEAAPVIVPPSFLKPELVNGLKTIWRGAADALRTSNVVVFVGYSFPPSDTEMRFFLAKALSANPSLRMIYLVDPNAEAIVTKLAKSEARMGTHFLGYLKSVPKKWHEVALSLNEGTWKTRGG